MPIPPEFVLDTNVMAAYLFREIMSELAKPVVDAVALGDATAVVPELFWAELQQVCYRKTQPSEPRSISLAEAETAYERSAAVGLVELGGELQRYRLAAWDLIRDLGLGSYDAYFLALALDLSLPVLTFDTRFRNPIAASPYAGAVLLIGEDVDA